MRDLLLEREQVATFERLVEAWLNRPREKRKAFMVLRVMGGTVVQGNGLDARDILWDDVIVLGEEGLIRIDWMTNGSGLNVTIPPYGLKVYDELHKQASEPTAELEDHIARYLDAGAFRSMYPRTYARWHEAADLLWGSESDRDFSTIGHICREALQDFVTELIERHEVTDANPDKAATRERFSAVLAKRRPEIGDGRADFLDALFNYWREVGNLAQRQEHAGQREGEDLIWEDGRRVVFHTALVTFEIARSI